MKAYGLRLLVAILAIVPVPPGAQEVSYLVGIDLTSNYVVNGFSDSNDKPAIQPYFEVSIDGFYFGTWMSTVDLGSDDVEIDLYTGYRTALGQGLAVDVGYARYLYNDTGNCCGEFTLSLGYAPSDSFGIDLRTAYNPDSEKFNNRVTLGYVLTQDFGLSATYGYTQSTRTKYWHVGASYAFNDRVLPACAITTPQPAIRDLWVRCHCPINNPACGDCSRHLPIIADYAPRSLPFHR